MTTDARDTTPTVRDFEGRIGRLLIGLTYIAVAFVVVGVGLMVASGIGPLDGGPSIDPGKLVADLGSLEPAAFLWLGFAIVLVTPITRVTVAGIAYARQGQWSMVLVSVGIVVVIALGVGISLSTER
jgi:uncharacterized membrane protein